MKTLLSFLLLLFFLSVSHSGKAQDNNIYIKDIPANGDYTADFKKVSDNVNANYTHLKNKNIDGPLLQSEYLALVKDARTNLEYGAILIRYFAALKNSHANAIFKKYYKNCSALLLENRVFMAYVGDSLFIKSGIREKDEVLQINNIPVLTYLQNQAKYTSASTDLHRTYLAASNLFSNYFEEDRTYTLKTASGEKKITVHFDDTPIRQAQQPSRPSSQSGGKVERKILNDRVAYINLLSMTGNVVDEFVQAYDTLCKKPFLIIDLRRNQGGNSGYSEKIAEYLLSKKQKACVSSRWLTPRENHFTGKLFVLTSPYTVSAAESFALDLLESGNATLIGMPTAGDTGNQPQFYNSEMGYSYWFPSRSHAQVSPKGFAMEGESLQPQYAVHKTVADYLADNDTILEYALHLISKN